MAVMLALLMGLSVLAVPAFAEDAVVMIDCNTHHSDADGEPLKIHFKNVETGEELVRSISTIGVNRFSDIPPGEYEYVKCTHERNENLEYPLRGQAKNLVFNGKDSAVYLFSLNKSAADEQTNDAKKELEHSDSMAWMLLLAMISVLTILIFWIIYAVKGRKNEHKRMIGKFFFHLMFALFAFWVAYFIIEGDMDQFFVCMVAACFPYGVVLASYFLMPNEEKMTPMELEQEQNSSGVRVLLVIALGVIIGVIAFPIVLIRDIIKIFTSRKYNLKV